MSDTSLTYAEHATIHFGGGLAVDCYMMPNGEFRFGLVGASKLMGYDPSYLTQSLKRDVNQFESLAGQGFEAPVEVKTGKAGRPPKTLSLESFSLLLGYEASIKGNQLATSLLVGFSQLSLLDYARDAFGLSPLTIEEKRRVFYKAYAQTINWIEEDKQDVFDLALVGDGVFSRG